MFDLYALIIRLTARNSGVLAGSQGQLAHAAFHNILHQVDPALAQAVHDFTGRKPFTISQLQQFGRHRHGKLHIRSGQQGYLRVTLSDPTLFQTFINYFLHNTHNATIRLNAIEFSVSEIISTPDSHALAGYTSRQALFDYWQTVELTPAHQTIDLFFASPTTFSLRSKPYRAFYLLPSADFVFGQLANIWDQLSGQTSAEIIQAYATEWVLLTRHNIRTTAYQIRKNPQIGFEGDVRYEIKDHDNPALIRHLNLLADLAFFTGVGSKTTHGMGQLWRP